MNWNSGPMEITFFSLCPLDLIFMLIITSDGTSYCSSFFFEKKPMQDAGVNDVYIFFKIVLTSFFHLIWN
jgi:hypothetical protein